MSRERSEARARFGSFGVRGAEWMMVFPSCAQRGRAAALAEGALVPGTHCPRRLLLQDETSRVERERELGRPGRMDGDGERKRERRRAAVSQPGGSGPERSDSGTSLSLLSLSLSLSLSFSSSSERPLASSFSCCFPSRGWAPLWPPSRATPRRSQNHLCVYVYTPPDRNPPRQ